MNVIQTIVALFQLAPAILQFIVQLQQIFGPGTGSVKKAAIMAPLDGAAPELQTKVSSFVDKMVPLMKAVNGPIPRAASPLAAK